MARTSRPAPGPRRGTSATGTPGSAAGDGTSAGARGARASANAFIKTYGRARGHARDSTLDTAAGVWFERKSESGTTLSTVAAKQKVPCLKANVVYAFDKAGALLGVMGRYRSV